MSILQARFMGRTPPPRPVAAPEIPDEEEVETVGEVSPSPSPAPVKRRPPPPQYDDLLYATDKIFAARLTDLKLNKSELGRQRFADALQNSLNGDRLELRASGIGETAALELTRAIQRSRQQPWFIDLTGNMMCARAKFSALTSPSN